MGVEAPASPRHLAIKLKLVCAETWGGNRAIDAPFELPGVRGKIYSRPCAGGRGGDVHYLSVCGSGLLTRMCLADVVGHGESVSQVSSAIHELLRRYMNTFDQRAVLAKLNRRLTHVGLKALTTAAAVTYYPPGRTLSVSYAGHPPAWLYRGSEDRWSRLVGRERGADGGSADLPLAVEPNVRFTRITRKVEYGDRILMVTDGVLEVPDEGGRLFGPGRLEDVLAAGGRAGTAELADRIIEAATRHAGAAGLEHDDATLLIGEFVPGPRGPTVWHAIRNRVVRPRGNGDDPVFADARRPRAAAASQEAAAVP